MGKDSTYNKRITHYYNPHRAFKGVDEKFYYTYTTYNTVNGKYYKGKHITKKLYDGYIGSSRILNLAVAKYGEENFITEVNSFYHNRLDLRDAEIEFVGDEWFDWNMCYNKACPKFGNFREPPKYRGRKPGTFTEELQVRISDIDVENDLDLDLGYATSWSREATETKRLKHTHYHKEVILETFDEVTIKSFSTIYEAVDTLRNLKLNCQAKKIMRSLSDPNRSHPRGFYWKYAESSTTISEESTSEV